MRKRFLMGIMAAMMTMSLVPQAVFADEVTDTGVENAIEVSADQTEEATATNTADAVQNASDASVEESAAANTSEMQEAESTAEGAVDAGVAEENSASEENQTDDNSLIMDSEQEENCDGKITLSGYCMVELAGTDSANVNTEEKTGITYAVSYNGNGATSGSMAALTDCKSGTRYTLAANAFKKNGYSFAGWNTKKDGTGLALSDKSSIRNLTMKDGNTVTLYAQWIANSYTIKFNGNGATSGSMSSVKCTYGTSRTLAANAFKKTGYTFAGWNTRKDGTGVAINNKAAVKNLTLKDGNTVTLYAQWKKVSTAYVTLSVNESKTAGGYTFTDSCSGKVYIRKNGVTVKTIQINGGKCITNGVNFYYTWSARTSGFNNNGYKMNNYIYKYNVKAGTKTCVCSFTSKCYSGTISALSNGYLIYYVPTGVEGGVQYKLNLSTGKCAGAIANSSYTSVTATYGQYLLLKGKVCDGSASAVYSNNIKTGKSVKITSKAAAASISGGKIYYVEQLSYTLVNNTCRYKYIVRSCNLDGSGVKNVSGAFYVSGGKNPNVVTAHKAYYYNTYTKETKVYKTF